MFCSTNTNTTVIQHVTALILHLYNCDTIVQRPKNDTNVLILVIVPSLQVSYQCRMCFVQVSYVFRISVVLVLLVLVERNTRFPAKYDIESLIAII